MLPQLAKGAYETSLCFFESGIYRPAKCFITIGKSQKFISQVASKVLFVLAVELWGGFDSAGAGHQQWSAVTLF